jgi:hypothetical protein
MDNREETMACQEKTEAHLQGEPASEDMTSEVAHEQEVPREDAEVMPVGEPRKRRRDGRNLAAVCRQKKKDQNLDAGRRKKGQKRAQRKDGCRRNVVAARGGANHSARHRILSTKDTTREYRESRKKLAATGGKETRRAKVARHKRNFVGGNRRMGMATGGNHTKNKVERGTQRIWALKKRFWTRQIGRAGPEDLSGGPYVASRNIKWWNLWRGRPPPRGKKSNGVRRAGYGEPRPIQELAPPLVWICV